MKNFNRSLLIFLVVVIYSINSSVFAYQTDEKDKKSIEGNKVIVVAVTHGRVREEPSLQAEILKESKIGTRYKVLEEKDKWAKIQINESEDKMGWISKTITRNYDQSRPGLIYQQIVDKYFERKKIDFATASELFEFLPKAADEAKTYNTGGDLRLKRLKILDLLLSKIPSGKDKLSPYKEFIEKYRDYVVYSEPAGQWFVRSKKFWELHARYREHKIGEKIAWQAALNPTVGECEGYINCHLYRLRITYGEYLNFYPNGKQSKQALQDVFTLLQHIVSDLPEKKVYFTANDISDRAEFNKILSDIRKIVSNSPHLEKAEIIKQIHQIAEGYR